MPKPAFDPSKPFEEVKPAFDPSKPYQEVNTPSREISEIESGLVGAGQGALFNFGDELGGAVAAGYDKLTGSKEPYSDRYRTRQKELESYANEAERQNPKSYMAGSFGGDVALSLSPAGAIVNPIKGAKIAKNVGKMAGLGALYGAGRSEGNFSSNEDIQQLLVDAGLGGLTGGAVQGAFQAGGKALSGLKPSNLRKFANDAAENATGATGLQASKFQDNAGKELLERGVVKFGTNAEDVAQNAKKQLDAAHQNLDPLLAKMDEQGAFVSKDQILEGLQAEINNLKGRSSQSGVVKQLKQQMEDVAEGMDVLPLTVAEQEKRAFQGQVNYNTDKITYDAKKKIANIYRRLVEDEATKIDPNSAKLFMDAKKAHGLLEPIREASERRAETLKQSPWGGLLDTAAFGTGALGTFGGSGDPSLSGAAGLATALARRKLAPRLSSSAAVSANKLAGAIERTPEMIAAFSEDVAKAIQAGNIPANLGRRLIDLYSSGEE
jgi:hypothetical protein